MVNKVSNLDTNTNPPETPSDWGAVTKTALISSTVVAGKRPKAGPGEAMMSVGALQSLGRPYRVTGCISGRRHG